MDRSIYAAGRIKGFPSRAAILFAVLLSAVLPSSHSFAEMLCKPVHGRFQSQVQPPGMVCTSPVGLCTKGQVIGGLQADFDLTVNSLFPADPVNIPTVMFFTGISTMHIKGGGLIIGADAGALDTDPLGDGHFSSLITFVEGASGHIILTANADLAAGVVGGDYSGELCTP